MWVDWNDLHADKKLADFKRKNPDAASHIKGGTSQEVKDNNFASMSNDDHSSPPVATISGVDLPPEVRELFLNWRPTVPSSWTTPPESEGEDTAVSTGSSPIHRNYYQPQTLIPTNLSLNAAHTPYTTNLPLSSDSTSSEDSFPCPTPEITTTNTPSPDPIPIPPQPLLEGEHAVGPVHLDTGSHDTRPPLQVIHIPEASQEAQALRSNTGRTPSPGAAGADGPANKWEEADPGLTWEDYGPRPEVPKGYILNEGADYIAFDIRLPSGEIKPAKYIKVEYGEDPLVYGMIDGDHHQYVESFQATPFPSAGPLRTYTLAQLEVFEEDHDLRPEVNSAIHHLYNKSVMAEVECYRINRKKLKRDYEELRQVQHDIWKRELTIGGCTRCMGRARIYQRMEVINRV